MLRNIVGDKLLAAAAVLQILAAGASAQTHNVLTAEEEAAGYQLLLDNTTALSVKWQGILNETAPAQVSANPPASWSIANDTTNEVVSKVLLIGTGSGHLVTRDSTYQNFDLKVEWKVKPQTNSGIFIRYRKINGWAGASGPEAQVVSIDHTDGSTPLHRAGTMYDMFPLAAGRENWFGPTGAWNQFRIIAFNNKVAHYGAGLKLVEYDMTSPAYDTAYSKSKYRTYPQYKTVHPGSIYLQHHGETGIKYRNFRIKKLDSAQNPWAAGSPYLNTAGTGMRDSLTFNDNLYAPTAIAPRNAAAAAGVTLSRNARGVSIRFARPGDYTLQVHDLKGALVSRGFTRGTDPYMLSTDFRGLGILRISAHGKTLLQSVLSPL